MNFNKFRITLSIFIVLSLAAQPSFPCSAVFLKTGKAKMIGRTMDWKTGKGIVSVNERGALKKALYIQDGSVPAEWAVKYGSITFDLEVQFSFLVKILMKIKGMRVSSGSSCGINEKGLYGGGLWIHSPPDVVYPKKDGRKSINDWQFLEYALDNFSNVEDLVSNIENVRVAGFKEGDFEVDLHWFFADASGDSVIIEFPDGKYSVHRNPSPLAITNSFYEPSREYLKEYRGFGGGKEIPFETGEMTSLNRFIFASYFLRKAEGEKKNSPEIVMDIMNHVTQTNVRHAQTSQAVTQWTSVYDLSRNEIYWKSRTNPETRFIKVSDINFAKSGRNRAVDINASLTGDITHLLK